MTHPIIFTYYLVYMVFWNEFGMDINLKRMILISVTLKKVIELQSYIGG